MEEKRILCKNNGMQRDINISAINQDGNIMYAFDNHNIRITSNEDNTIWTVTNEKSTEYIGNIAGIFMGACIIDKYLVLFIKDATGISGYLGEDYIYRLEVITQDEGIEKVEVKMLYNGNLNFNVEHPIEAIGYYENEDVIKVYWVDGINPNRFINVAKMPKEVFYIIDANNKRTENNEYFLGEQVQKEKGIPLYEIKGTDGELYYYTLLNPRLDFIDFNRGFFYDKTEVENIISGTDWTEDDIRNLKGSAKRCLKGFEYVDTSFDFQGEVYSIPDIKIRKDYNLSGHFQAGVIQYFFTYYNKFGQETPIIYNSDLQYLSIKDRGAKADEAVVCGFIIDVTNIDVKYDYLRIYAAYRSGLNGTVTSRIVGELDLSKQRVESTLRFIDLGNEGQTFNSNDLFYVGGQNIIGGTIEHKEDTLFVGDITIKGNTSQYDLPKYTKIIPEVQNTPLDEEEVPKPIEIQEGGSEEKPFIEWVYQYTSEVPTQGVYTHTNELQESQEEIAGFKWREFYRFGIQFMNKTGEWSSAFWLGDKYCNLKPISINEECFIDDWKDTYSSNVVLLKKEDKDKDDLNTVRVYSPTGSIAGSKKIVETEDEAGNKKRDEITMYCDNFKILYQGYGNYIAKAKVNIDYIKEACKEINDAGYIGYRLLLAHPDESNRRIITQGVINPTMFNFYDRYYDIPHSIPSWLFRPRNGFVTNRHYDTLPVQTELNAELQGITERQVPVLQTGFQNATELDCYLCIFGLQSQGGIESEKARFYTKYKLIYFSGGTNLEDKKKRAALMSWQPIFEYDTDINIIKKAHLEIATLCYETKVALHKGLWIKNKNKNDWYDTALQIETKKTGGMTDEQVKAAVIEELCAKLNENNTRGKDDDYNVSPPDNKDYSKLDTNKVFYELWQPCWIYGSNYKVVADHTDKSTGNRDGQAKDFKNGITNAELRSAEKKVGNLMGGKKVIPEDKFFTGSEVGKLRNHQQKVKDWIKWVGVIAIAIVGIVCSVFTGGASLGISISLGAWIVCSIGTAICAPIALGLGALILTQAEYNALEDWQKICYDKGWLWYFNTDNDNRAREISSQMNKYFRPNIDSKIDVIDGANWDKAWLQDDRGKGYHPYLKGYERRPFQHKVRSGMWWNQGKYWIDCIDKEFNAVYRVGYAGDLDAIQKELQEKQNVYCVDESIVSLNSPNIEDVYHYVNNANAYDLEIIGTIPLNSTKQDYDIYTESGLTSNTQVLRGRNKSSDIKNGAIQHIVNDDLYQDFRVIDSGLPNSYDTTKTYDVSDDKAGHLFKMFMWNRQKSAGFWFDDCKLKNQIGDAITTPKGKLVKKIFANLNFSTTSMYYNPFKMDIEQPVVCLDNDNILKNIFQNNNYRKYQEAVNTLSINKYRYPLLIDNVQFPDDIDDKNNKNIKGIKDSISIKYKETPHIILPFKFNGEIATILPITDENDMVSPFSLYGREEIIDEETQDIQKGFDPSVYDWYGIKDITTNPENYIYLPVYKYQDKTEDEWNKIGVLSNEDLFKLHDLLVEEGYGIATLIEQIHKPINEIYTGADSNITLDNNIIQTTLLPLQKIGEVYYKYLLQVTSDTYYELLYEGKKWKSVKFNTNKLMAVNSVLLKKTMNDGSNPIMSYQRNTNATTNKSYIYPIKYTTWGLYKQGKVEIKDIPSVFIQNVNDLSKRYDTQTNDTNVMWYIPYQRYSLPWGTEHKNVVTDNLYYINSDKSVSNKSQSINISTSGNSIISVKEGTTYLFYNGAIEDFGKNSNTYIKYNKENNQLTIEKDTNNRFEFKTLEEDKQIELIGSLAMSPESTIVLSSNQGDYNVSFYVNEVLVFKELSSTINADATIKTNTLYATLNRSNDNETYCKMDTGIDNIFTISPITNTWYQPVLNWYFANEINYLFLGELVKKIFDYKSWMGGTEENALEQLVWDVASHPTNMDKNIINSWGDTYYQRWDCLKTYPYTEDDPNSIVEVLSYMCETHKNIAGRCDTNRSENNLLTTRPENTMYNNVYEQLDNFFTYTLLDEKFFKNHFKADFVWSLKKQRLNDIDVWTSLTSLNEMSLDGRYGTLRKILNSKNNLIAFQDRAINIINYNDKVALNTTTDMPVQLGNTGKVTGYTMVTDEHGCRNKFAINKNSTGVYFIDDLNKTFNFIGGENGIASISTKANFSAWFKHNVNGELLDASKFNNFILSYDESTNDLYLIKNDTCLVYNTILGRFVSFMDYTNTPLITRLANDKGLVSSYALHGRVDKDGVRYLDLWKMFSKYTTEENGENKVYHYNYIFGKFAEYSMEYRITPNAVTESIFTNYLFTADWIDPVRDVDGENLFNEQPIIRFTSFDEIEAKNEYQKGKATITPTLNHNFGNRQMGIQDLKNKFRIWRGNIPRDGDGNAEARPFMRDRMRNMWIHLKLTKKKADDSKMIFHDLLVTYFN